MSGFKKFIMRGNLIELAVAFIVGAAFTKVVQSFTAIILALVGKLGGSPDFSNYHPGNVPIGAFLTALFAFLILAAVIYFFIVRPYETVKTRLEKPATPGDTVESLLAEIRDELRNRAAQP